MRPPKSRAWLIGAGALGVLVIGALVVFLALRGGDDDPAAETQTSEPPPDSTGLFSAAALPGSGWTSEETELVALFDAPNPAFAVTPDVAQCAPLQPFEAALFENETAFQSGVSRSFQRAQADGGTVRVTQLAMTFTKRDAVDAILRAARDSIGGPELAPCILAAAATSGIVATAEERPAIPVPADGLSRVVRYTAAAPSGGGIVTQAFAVWGDGDRLLILTVAAAGDGPNDGELSEIARAARGTGGNP